MPGVPPTAPTPRWDAFCMSLPMQIKPARDEQLSPCREGSVAGGRVKGGSARGFAGAPDGCKDTAMESSRGSALSSRKKGCSYTNSGNGREPAGGAGRLPPVKASDAPCAAQNLPGKPDGGFFWLCFSTCNDAQVFLITPEQKTFLYRSIVF